MHGGNVWQGDAPEQWFDFSANTRPEGAPEWVTQAALRGMRHIRYYPDPEMRRMTDALAACLGIPSGCVLPAAGGVSAIDLAMYAAESGVTAVEPCFSEYRSLAARHGLPFRGFPMSAGLQAIPDSALAGGLLCLTNPNNPTGRAFGTAETEQLLCRVEKANGYLLADEAFIEYCPEFSVRQAAAARERLLVAGSMTKILGIPGLRLGYLCGHPRTLGRLRAKRLPWEVNAVAEAVACALPDHAEDIRRDAEISAERRQALARALEDTGAFVYDSQAPFLLVKYQRPVHPLAQWLKNRRILVRECMDFAGVDDGYHLRMAVKDEESNARLTEALKEGLLCAENR